MPDWYCQEVGYYTSHCIFQRDIVQPFGLPGVLAYLVILGLVVGVVCLVLWLRHR